MNKSIFIVSMAMFSTIVNAQEAGRAPFDQKTPCMRAAVLAERLVVARDSGQNKLEASTALTTAEEMPEKLKLDTLEKAFTFSYALLKPQAMA
jgi:hypothetical protein